MVLRAHIKCEENGFLAQGTGKNLFLTFCRRTRTTPPYADSTGGRCRDHYNFNASFNIVLVLLPYGTDSKRKRRACAGCRNAEVLKNLQPTSQETSLNIRRWNVRLRSSSSQQRSILWSSGANARTVLQSSFLSGPFLLLLGRLRHRGNFLPLHTNAGKDLQLSARCKHDIPVGVN